MYSHLPIKLKYISPLRLRMYTGKSDYIRIYSALIHITYVRTAPPKAACAAPLSSTARPRVGPPRRACSTDAVHYTTLLFEFSKFYTLHLLTIYLFRKNYLELDRLEYEGDVAVRRRACTLLLPWRLTGLESLTLGRIQLQILMTQTNAEFSHHLHFTSASRLKFIFMLMMYLYLYMFMSYVSLTYAI